MNRTELQAKCSEINRNSNGIIALVSGSADFKVGDKVKLRGDMGGFKLTITAIHNDHYCTAKGYGKERHFNMCFLEHYR